MPEGAPSESNVCFGGTRAASRHDCFATRHTSDPDYSQLRAAQNRTEPPLPERGLKTPQVMSLDSKSILFWRPKVI